MFRDDDMAAPVCGRAGEDRMIDTAQAPEHAAPVVGEGGAGQPHPETDWLDALYTPVDGARGDIYHADTSGDGTSRFSGIETVVPCFTPGARVATARGFVPVERLRVGDRVQTADNGLQPVIWVGLRRIAPTQLALRPGLRPVRIGPGAIGNSEALLVSPQHRFLAPTGPQLRNAPDGEHFVSAGLLAALPGFDATVCRGARSVTYAHFMTERHEVVFVDGVATETLYPGRRTLDAMPPAALAEIAALFPALSRNGPGVPDPSRVYGPLARPELTLVDLGGRMASA
ncbi:Hint domain-containing protein [Roseibacterium sp. SDUM158016]|uniref:Hint domain-containing protein n=1 Tax=Roseicyclus sediminis TaxID=2980997 RepID=UPI0021D1B7CA|nr:Hint domain-containing protein [Roseibacterium sp. SDUM158016]MCU4655202.1 Hint domain-containing protein [Roseibacterium sp. SDUM158016]